MRQTPFEGEVAKHQWSKSKINLLQTAICPRNRAINRDLPSWGGLSRMATRRVSTYFWALNAEMHLFARCVDPIMIDPVSAIYDLFTRGPSGGERLASAETH